MLTEDDHTCAACGMSVKPRAYHPHAACLMFRACHDGNVVDANLQAVVEYGHLKTDQAEELKALRTLAEKASDYKFGKGQKQFAKLNGGVRKLEQELLEATEQWESVSSVARDA